MMPTLIVQTENFRVVRLSPRRIVIEQRDGVDALGNERWITSARDDLEKAFMGERKSLRLELILHIERNIK